MQAAGERWKAPVHLSANIARVGIPGTADMLRNRNQLQSFIGAMVLFAIGASTVVHSAEIGAIPPDVLGKDEDGQEIRLSESKGRIRVVSFWASWCPPCLRELPMLNAVQEHAGVERIQVFAINLKESNRQYSRARRHFKDFEITFLRDRRGRVAEQYEVVGIPHMLIIDVDGRVVHKHSGYRVEDLPGIVDELNALLIKNNLGVTSEE